MNFKIGDRVRWRGDGQIRLPSQRRLGTHGHGTVTDVTLGECYVTVAWDDADKAARPVSWWHMHLQHLTVLDLIVDALNASSTHSGPHA